MINMVKLFNCGRLEKTELIIDIENKKELLNLDKQLDAIDINKYIEHKNDWYIKNINIQKYPCPFLKYIYNIKIDIKNTVTAAIAVGEAESNSKSEAIVKAFAEAYERYIFARNATESETTNGYAAHTNITKAINNAMCEVIERDAILRM